MEFNSPAFRAKAIAVAIYWFDRSEISNTLAIFTTQKTYRYYSNQLIIIGALLFFLNLAKQKKFSFKSIRAIPIDKNEKREKCLSSYDKLAI